MAPELEIRCNIASAARARARYFLDHYMLSIEGAPYAIKSEFVRSGNNEYVEISPVEGARIAALIPVQGSKLGSFEGANFQRDVPRQMAITLDEFKYVIYENPKPIAREANTPPTSSQTGHNQRAAAGYGEDEIIRDILEI